MVMNKIKFFRRALTVLPIYGLLTFSESTGFSQENNDSRPFIASVANEVDDLVVEAGVASGYRHAVLEALSDATIQGPWINLISGSLDGNSGIVTFRFPDPGSFQLIRIRVGTDETVPEAQLSGDQFFSVEYTDNPGDPGGDPGGGNETDPNQALISEEQKVGHLLNRIGYGPNIRDLQTVQSMGIKAYIEQQLNPKSIVEDDPRLEESEFGLFENIFSSPERSQIMEGDIWKYIKGTEEPPENWNGVDFDDDNWSQGATGIGYGDDDDATILADMRNSYLSVYLRKTFTVENALEVTQLNLSVFYDDGFVAYLNGREIARANMDGERPPHDQTATATVGNFDEADFSISTVGFNRLNKGENVLAIQVHNTNLTSSDLSMRPEVSSYTSEPLHRMTQVRNLQNLVHVRGAYSRKQLQTVLAEFWENHFTTDFDKVEEYMEDLEDIYDQPAMNEDQATEEAAEMEFTEYQFFYDNALGNFGDLLLYSATSPPQLIYLDNVQNLKDEPNENYAREILELFAFGVDNRYNQTDIEELAKCFTGWSIRKVRPENHPSFPASSRTPPIEDQEVSLGDIIKMNHGTGWRYLKGTEEPSPNEEGEATTDWTQPDFDITSWSLGPTVIGYEEKQTPLPLRTELNDMNGNYVSVYIRRNITFNNLENFRNTLLEISYDDGYVAYINGEEVKRSRTLRNYGEPPTFDQVSRNKGNEARPDFIRLQDYWDLLKEAPETNVIAVQAHNQKLQGSSDFNVSVRLIERRLTPDSIAMSDRNAEWAFRFDPDEHNLEPKTLFGGTPHEISIPGNRVGLEGVNDAIDVIDAMVHHPSTIEHITIKLLNRFVSDELSLATYHDRSAPEDLLKLEEKAIAAWHSTHPPGNIKTVMTAILDPYNQSGCFWTERAFQTKIKTPIEFINSSIRALDGDIFRFDRLPARNSDMGMELFRRDDPNGWSEIGFDWIDTGTMLERVQFSRNLALSSNYSGTRWNFINVIRDNNLETGEDIIDYFDELLFQGTLSDGSKTLLLEFVNTNQLGNFEELDPTRRNNFQKRVKELLGLVLSLPEWHFQ